MKNQHILFTAPGVAELVDKALPEMKETDVLVRVARTSVSAGTEKANLIGDRVTFRGDNKPFPRQCGYSAAGVVEAVGAEVTTVKVCDRVACSWSNQNSWCNYNQ